MNHASFSTNPPSSSTQLTAEFVAHALSISLPSPSGGATGPFSKVTSDSRQVELGSLFVALAGEKFDGHQFIDTAIAQGAAGVICKKGTSNLPTKKSFFAFFVDDTLEAYRKLAHEWRKKFTIPVVGVAGSAGKTTTKEILSAILAGKGSPVLKTQGSQNGFVGIPMTLLDLRSEHRAAIIEIGIDEIGAMEKHIRLVAPTHSVLTSIGPEHLHQLRDVPTVAREEGFVLTQVAAAGGCVVINLDDPWIRPYDDQIKTEKKICFTLGSSKGPHPSPCLVGQFDPDAQTLRFEGMSPAPLLFPLPLPGKHNASNLLAAIAVAYGLGLSSKEIGAGLKTFVGAEGRSQIRELAGEFSVLCDYYNAQPASVEAGLDLLTQISKNRSQVRWACLGDMLELGAEEESYHRALAKKLSQLKVEHVLMYGPRMAALEDELKKIHYPGSHAHFQTHMELANALAQGIRKGDTLLIKGSRGMKMEEVWKLLSSRF